MRARIKYNSDFKQHTATNQASRQLVRIYTAHAITSLFSSRGHKNATRRLKVQRRVDRYVNNLLISLIVV